MSLGGGVVQFGSGANSIPLNYPQSQLGYVTPFYPSMPPEYQYVKEKPNMRGLFQVYIVDPTAAGIVCKDVCIAQDESSAKLKVAAGCPALKDKDFDDFDFIVVHLGDVRPKAKKVTHVSVE